MNKKQLVLNIMQLVYNYNMHRLWKGSYTSDKLEKDILELISKYDESKNITKSN